MPLYEYQCDLCGKVHEIMQKFSDPPMEKCLECPGSVRKIMSATHFTLKGTGWYTTDYKKKTQGGAESGASVSKPTAGTGTSVESKPAQESKTSSEGATPVSAKPAVESKPVASGAVPSSS